MKQILFSLLAALIMVGCAREDVEFNQEVPVSHSTRAEEGLVEAGGVSIELTKIGPAASEPVLVFKNYQDILTLLSEMDGMNVEEKIARVKKLVPGFVSIQEQYDIALHEIDSLVNTEEEYEAFKQKYPQFYYANDGEDCGVYIPMEDQDLAFLCSQSCKIIVGNQVLAKKLESPYATLKRQGLTYSEDIDSVPGEGANNQWGNFTYHGNKVDPIPYDEKYDSGWRIVGGHKIKLKSRRWIRKRVFSGGAYYWDGMVHVEICYRKKCGRWLNYRSKTITTLKMQENNGPFHEFAPRTERGYSSHDMNFGIPCRIIPNSFGFFVFTYPLLNCEADVKYQGMPNIQKFKWSLAEAYYNSHSTNRNCIPVIEVWH